MCEDNVAAAHGGHQRGVGPTDLVSVNVRLRAQVQGREVARLVDRAKETDAGVGRSLYRLQVGALVVRAADDEQRRIDIGALELADDDVGVVLRLHAADEQVIGAWLHAVASEDPSVLGLVLDVQDIAAVGEEGARCAVLLEIELLQLLGVGHQVVGDLARQPVVGLQVGPRETTPLAPLPVETVGIDDKAPAQQPMGQVGPHGAAAEHVVDVLPGHEERIEAAEELVEDRLGELAVDGRQPDDTDALPALAHVGAGVLGHGEEGHIVPGLGESRGQLGHDGVEPAPPGRYPTRTEDGDSHATVMVANPSGLASD